MPPPPHLPPPGSPSVHSSWTDVSALLLILFFPWRFSLHFTDILEPCSCVLVEHNRRQSCKSSLSHLVLLRHILQTGPWVCQKQQCVLHAPQNPPPQHTLSSQACFPHAYPSRHDALCTIFCIEDPEGNWKRLWSGLFLSSEAERLRLSPSWRV